MADLTVDQKFDLFHSNIDEFLLERLRTLKQVAVHGVEVTQSIQYFDAERHLTDPADRGPDNSVRLIANKPAWVRVYARANFAEAVPGITAALRLDRRSHGFIWSTIATLSPQAPGAITAHRTVDYASERGTLADTLNFIIPADQFRGVLQLKVQLLATDGSLLDEQVVPIDATLRQTLRIRAILVSYSGPSTAAPPPGSPPPPTINLPAPSLANLATTAGLALRAMPVQSQGNYASAGTLPWGLPLDDPRSCPGCCSPNWNALLASLGTVRTNDGNRSDVVYYGLLPAAIPLGVPGCGAGGLGSAISGNQTTFMHEIGHGYGFQHTPCGNAGATDASYPTYEPYPSASIGEYGLDIADGTIYSPAMTSDYMSYCGPRWMSLYQYQRLILHPRLGQQWLRDDLIWDRYQEWRRYDIRRDLPYPPPDPFAWEDLRMNPVIAISGVVQRSGPIEVRSIARVAAMGRPPGQLTPLLARLVDQDGMTLASARLRRLATQAGGCGCCPPDEEQDDEAPATYAFEVYVPDVADGAALTIEDGEHRLWQRSAPATRPVVTGFRAEADGDLLHLRWKVDGTKGDGSSTDNREQGEEADAYEVWVQWSDDRATSWHGLATGLSGTEATVDATPMPSGTVLVRLLVHAGFFTAVAEPVPVTIPPRAPQAAILHPEENGILAAGSPLRLWGAVLQPNGEPVAEAWCRWVLDGREVAQGCDAWIDVPEEGDHGLLLHVRGAQGEAEASVRFRSVPGPFSKEQRICG